jgi:hypothetical protein
MPLDLKSAQLKDIGEDLAASMQNRNEELTPAECWYPLQPRPVSGSWREYDP